MYLDVDLTYISATDIIVVANNRQVLAFKQTFSVQHIHAQLPLILSWQQYLKYYWQSQQLNSNLRLIDSIEQHYLIESVLKQNNQTTHSRLINEVVKNYDYCTNHLINLKILTQSKVQICEAFVQWIDQYQQAKKDLELIDINDLATLLLNEKDTLKTPHIYGFKTLTPLQQQVFESLNFQEIYSEYSNNTVQKCFDNTNSEITQAALWAKQQQAKNPNHSIVVVCPNLNELRHQLNSTFDQVFNDLLIETGRKSYNISLGLPLSQYAFIQNIVNIFELNNQISTEEIHTDLFNKVITSVYTKGYQLERSTRHLLANKAKSLALETIKLELLEEELSQCPILLDIIKTLDSDKKTQTLSTHLLGFNHTLTHWGLATDRNLSSGEFQLLNKYLSSSLKLNQLSLHQKKCSAKTAINILKDLINQVIFQPQSSKANIQIIGSLEAEGLRFDQAWVMGMTHDFLPAKLNAPRFITSVIAAHHQIPHSNYELIQSDSKNTLKNLQSLAKNVIFSYAKSHLESEQLPSPLLNFKVNTLPQSEIKASPINIETIDDNVADKFESGAVKSGVTLLKNQMACAFKGFVHRLDIEYYDDPHIGLDRREQGNIIHNALQYIYQAVNSQEALLKLNQSELNTLIDQKLYAALKRHPDSNFKKIEKTRLNKLLHKFIETDKSREDFRVLATEQSIHVDIAGLNFNTRLDRLDEVSNGDKIVFDYKTGSTSTAKWCGQSIVEPQLPIYSISNNIQGAAFIELNSNAISFKGLSKDPDSIPKQSRRSSCQEWDEQLGIWTQKLNQASQDFQSGQAQVLPNKTACDYCEFDLLCRVEST